MRCEFAASGIVELLVRVPAFRYLTPHTRHPAARVAGPATRLASSL